MFCLRWTDVIKCRLLTPNHLQMPIRSVIHILQSCMRMSDPIWCIECEILSKSRIKKIPRFFSQLNARLNPGCPPTICNDDDGKHNQTVIHIEADAEYDTLHYIWDFRKQPSVLVALTKPNTTMNIKWERFLNDSPSVLEFSNEPTYTMSFVLTKVSVCDDGAVVCVRHANRPKSSTTGPVFYWLIRRLATADGTARFEPALMPHC